MFTVLAAANLCMWYFSPPLNPSVRIYYDVKAGVPVGERGYAFVFPHELEADQVKCTAYYVLDGKVHTDQTQSVRVEGNGEVDWIIVSVVNDTGEDVQVLGVHCEVSGE